MTVFLINFSAFLANFQVLSTNLGERGIVSTSGVLLLLRAPKLPTPAKGGETYVMCSAVKGAFMMSYENKYSKCCLFMVIWVAFYLGEFPMYEVMLYKSTTWRNKLAS